MIRVRLLALALVGSCGPKTKIVTDSKAPEIQPEPLSKVVAIAMSEDPILPRMQKMGFVT